MFQLFKWSVFRPDPHCFNSFDFAQDIERVAGAGIGEPESHRQMATSCSQLSQWIDAFRDKLVDYTDFNSASKVSI